MVKFICVQYFQIRILQEAIHNVTYPQMFVNYTLPYKRVSLMGICMYCIQHQQLNYFITLKVKTEYELPQ